MQIRLEAPTDAARTLEIQRKAFGREDEADLVVALRAGGHALAPLCFVAEFDDEVVGHVVCSRGDLDGRPIPGLGPIGVLPEMQHRGVGSALMHAVIGAAEALDLPAIVLLGNPGYYGRFGFVASGTVDIAPPDPSWGHFFQARTLTAHDASVRGAFRYPAPFDDID